MKVATRVLRWSIVATVIAAVTLVLAPTSHAAEGVGYPAGYLRWPFVKGMVILKGSPLFATFGGVHRIYVNSVGLPASVRGGAYADGSVLVFDLFDAVEKNHTIQAGERKLTAVMQKDSTRFADTGGWGFQVFKAGSTEGSVKNAKKECFGCHSSQKKTDFVHSRFGK